MKLSEFQKHRGDLLFVPLGGSGEIGMNLNMYHLDGKWIIVDYGAGFAEDFMPGIDMIVPDIAFLRSVEKDILALVLTHAHEDHLGAVPHIWENFNFPIYAGPFTAAFLREKLKDSGMVVSPKVIEVLPGDRIPLGPFDVECVQLTHSTPEMHALFIRTHKGKVFHTGDWKFDPDPVAGRLTDMNRLYQLGDEGVDAVIGDSTNVFSEGVSGSEGSLLEPITELVRRVDGMAFVTTFASNVGRIETMARAARNSGRRMVLAGRSLWRVYRAAQSVGMLNDVPEPLDENATRGIPRKELMALVTGCQGEPMAAMYKIATEQHRSLKLLKGDEIIFSSKIIPGNEKRIHRMINRLIREGYKVHTEQAELVHVSGHPNRDELKHLYGVLKPGTVIPVHGEDIHMDEHARFAVEECGAKHSLRIHNGDVVKIDGGRSSIIGKVETGYFGIDGNTLLPPDGAVLKMRRRISKDGVVCITLITDESDHSLLQSTAVAPGLLDPHDDADLMQGLEREIAEALDEVRRKRHKRGDDLRAAEQAAVNAARRFIRNELGKSPPVTVSLASVSA